MTGTVVKTLGLAGAVLALGSFGTDRSLEQESKRLQALMAYARDQAELQTREFGLRLVPDGYEFVDPFPPDTTFLRAVTLLQEVFQRAASHPCPDRVDE